MTGFCECPAGFVLSGNQCLDINECLTNNGGCDANATCTNTTGSRTCACKSGFQGSGTQCSDVDECLTNNGGCDTNATCTNTTGSRTCACKSGFQGIGTQCSDINECLTNNGGCDTHAACANTPGSRTCTCTAPYSGTGLTCQQPTWSIASMTGPGIRSVTSMAYDPIRKQVVLFGGELSNGSSFQTSADTWVWDGASWSQKNVSGPGARTFHSMVYDSSRQRVVLFGGDNGNFSFFNDVWDWNGTSWSQRNTGTTRPTGRSSAAVTYDSTRNRLVVFGGKTGNSATDVASDLWELNGTTWTQVSANVTQLGARFATGSTFDAARNRTIVYGGIRYDGSGTAMYLNDTWAFNGTTWSQVDSGNGFGSLLIYDSNLQLVFRLAGSGSTNTAAWSGTSWANYADGPGKVAGAAYDQDKQKIVLYGGANPNLTYDTNTWVFGF